MKKKKSLGLNRNGLKVIKRKAFLEGQSWGVIISLLSAGAILGYALSKLIRSL